MNNRSALLIPQPPLQLLPSLALALSGLFSGDGVSEAVFLQQLHYLSQRLGHEKDGHVWVYNTYDDWSETFPFWSARIVRRIVAKLEESRSDRWEGGLIFTTAKYNKMPIDNTKWYRINYEALNVLTGDEEPVPDDTVKSSDDTVKSSYHNGQVVIPFAASGHTVSDTPITKRDLKEDLEEEEEGEVSLSEPEDERLQRWMKRVKAPRGIIANAWANVIGTYSDLELETTISKYEGRGADVSGSIGHISKEMHIARTQAEPQ